jgi:putative endonuclease
LGALGEQAAADYLRRSGYRIIGRGVRSGRGELDIVALDGQTIVIVEVKTQRAALGQHPAERVDARKQQLLCRTAAQFLKRNGWLDHSIRFDVIAIIWPAGASSPNSLQHFRGAFEMCDGLDV